MKTSEIKAEAKDILNTIFVAVLASDSKDDWKKAINFIDDKIFKLECGERWSEMFIWRKVKNLITFEFWKKFIAK